MAQACAVIVIFIALITVLYKTKLWRNWFYASKKEYIIIKNILYFFAVLTAILGII